VKEERETEREREIKRPSRQKGKKERQREGVRDRQTDIIFLGKKRSLNGGLHDLR
jgi:hypothetical protein